MKEEFWKSCLIFTNLTCQVQSSTPSTPQGPWQILTILHISWFTFYSHVVIWNILTTFFRGKHLRLTDNNIIPWCLHFLSGIITDSVLSPSASQVQSSTPSTPQGPWQILTILHISWFTFYSHVVIWNILTTFFRGKHLRLTDNNIIPWCLHFLSGIITDSVLSPSASQVQSSPTAQGPWPMLTILHVLDQML